MSYPDEMEHPERTDEEALRAIEFGSCDDCGQHNYCPVCGGHEESGHEDECPVPRLLATVDLSRDAY